MRKTIHILVGVIFITSMLLTASPPRVAHAATLTVDTNADENDGSCADDCSLRDAIALAAGGDTIDFASSLSGQTIHLASTLNINKNLTIDGSSLASPMTISGDTGGEGTGDVRVFYIFSGKTVTFQDLRIVKGVAGVGGGIINYGTLTVTDCELSDNSPADYGGGIYNTGTLTVTDSTFSDNSADYDGGGIHNTGGTLTVTNSTFSGNTSVGDGGGIFSGGTGTLTITNSTFSSNSADYGSGGGIYNTGGTLTVTNSTFSGNTSSDYGGGIFNGSAGTLTVINSTFSENLAAGGGGGGIYSSNTLNLSNVILANSSSSTGGDCVNSATMGTDINNLIESHSGCGTPVSTADPALGALADNGGPTQTMALHYDSPAIDAGSDADCPAHDQRGVDRPQGPHCDIGAYELVRPTTVTVNSTVDPGDTFCDISECTLREAIGLVASGGTVNFNTSLSGGTIPLVTTLVIDKDLTIDGSSLAVRLTLSGDTGGDGTGDVRVFYIYSGRTVTFQDLKIVKGVMTGGGGGIVNYGTLTVNECELSDNSATNQGGGIWSEGTLTVTDSTISSNSTTDNCGGGIYNSLGTMTVTDSTFSANSATGGSGGGLCNAGGTLTVTDSTFTDNIAVYNGGGIFNTVTLTVTDSTFSANTARGRLTGRSSPHSS